MRNELIEKAVELGQKLGHVFLTTADDKGVPQLTDIPVIIMTGDLRDEYGPLIKMCDIKRCLKKPFNPLDIINEIEAVSQ